jgi:hypothetical protein
VSYADENVKQNADPSKCSAAEGHAPESATLFARDNNASEYHIFVNHFLQVAVESK